ncbi:uncharacterized protein LOC129574392 [Sitodiplosis mosellana]|uniref:uncharacterized protein LOC129574392 n=1 Tax=Sitodiplosis mosellana TaxID=263140 RepID=UPI0024451875|nr:uncharacterized protein LOC129574392 [Sitodiplosis mosellana]
MSKLAFVFFVCAVLIQQQIQADIALSKYQPNVRDFYSNLQGITSKVNSLQIVEPKICNRLRDRLQENFRRYTGYVNEDKKKIEDTIQNSKSDKVKDATDVVKTAYDTVSNEFKKISDEASTMISDKCKQLGSGDTLKTISQAVADLKVKQKEAAKQLADLPTKYTATMQSLQAPIEAINVKV